MAVIMGQYPWQSWQGRQWPSASERTMCLHAVLSLVVPLIAAAAAFAPCIDASAQQALAFQVVSSNTGTRTSNQRIKGQPNDNGCFCSRLSSSLKSTALFPTRVTGTTRSTSRSTALWAVTFQYSSSALDHLAALDDARPADARSSSSDRTLVDHPSTPLQVDTENSSKNTSDNASNGMKLKATIGALSSMAAAILACQLLLPIEYADNASLLCSAAAAAAGYKLLSGDEAIRQANLPKDGGYDAKFVVDKPGRIRDILDRVETERYNIVESSGGRDLSDAIRLINQVHSDTYIEELREAVKDAKATDRIRRLHPVVMRTLIDQYSYDAAVDGVADWIDSIDAAMGCAVRAADASKSGHDGNGDVIFALTRPPSHHACVSRGMGGCLLNGPAIAAFRALELGAERVAILDIDAHHGNGIANCVQDEARIRYCSIHEEVVEKNWFKSEKDIEKKENSVDPRTPFREDRGKLGNILNIPLAKGTRWGGESGYRRALLEDALPFLTDCGKQTPDVLVLAAGFDALAVDATSGLALETKDYNEIGRVLRDMFGGRIAVGLEGGYVWQDGTLGEAVLQLMKPWASNARTSRI